MKRVLLVIAALLSLTVLLAACKKSGDTISTPAAESTPATVEATPAPTDLPPYEANVLTGEPKGADYPEGQRITAVMVNNSGAARPQRGLSKADILFEIKVEGGITRFMPVFTDYKTVGEVGPVRSGRDQFFRLILPWQALYIHEGQSVVMQQYAIDYDYGKLNNNDGANGYRDYCPALLCSTGPTATAIMAASTGLARATTPVLWRWSTRCTPTPTTSQTISAARTWT